MNEQDVNTFRQNMGTNQDYINNGSFMLARIDTSNLIRKIQKDIGGKVILLVQDKDGNFFERTEQVGRPLANEEGIMHICNIIEEMVNTHTVQGNLKEDHYWEFNARTREEVTETVISNSWDWDIQDKDLNHIIDKICRIVELFLTRPVDNEERKSYAKEFQSREVINNTETRNNGVLSSFGKGIGR